MGKRTEARDPCPPARPGVRRIPVRGGLLPDRGESRPGAASGYADALRAVFDGHASAPPTEDRLLALHAAVFRHIPEERARAGRYKSAGLREKSDRDFLSEPVALRSPAPS